jgi:lysophospholipase L1-like esterase
MPTDTTDGRTATFGAAGKIALAAASILATVLALEAALRVGAHLENRGLLSALPASGAPAPGSRVTLGQMIRRSPNARIIYELRPRLQVLYEGGRVTTNTHGFRGRELPVDKPPGAFRIVGLGDSYMFGQGVSDEETYLALLEASLGGRPSAREAQVINTAVPGYNTVMEVATLEAKGIAWRPDLVVLEVTGNDVDLPNFIRTPEDPAAGGRSFLAEFVARRLGRIQAPANRPEGLEPAPEEELHGSQRFLADPSRVPPEYRDMVGLDAWEKALRELREAGARSGVPVVVLTQGVSFDRRLWRLCRELGFHYLDVAPAIRRYLRAGGYREYVLSPLVIRQGDAHPSRTGHELIARELLGFLSERGLLGPG